MPELSLKQIEDKLNAGFAGDSRKLIFWYDSGGDFAGDIGDLKLENAKILCLEPDNQFYIKYFLERVDPATNYLLYAPFPKPELWKNHLADTLRYSKEFSADRASLLALDLGMDEACKPVLRQYAGFFASKERTRRFYELGLEAFTRDSIETALMSVLCRSKTASFEEVVRCVLTDGALEENVCLAELEKYGLLEPFWRQAEAIFGYSDGTPSLPRFVMTAFATCAARSISAEPPQAWIPFLSRKSGSIVAFLDNLMNSVLYAGHFDRLSAFADSALGVGGQLQKLPAEALLDCGLFARIDQLLIRWMEERLENEDFDARLNGRTLPEICDLRRKMHFGRDFVQEYSVLENGFLVMTQGRYTPVTGIEAVVKRYCKEGYLVDRHYRKFYFHFDQLEDAGAFEKLRELVEQVYTDRYLNPQTVNWNQSLLAAEGKTGLPRQLDFYNRFIRPARERTVIILSDALRYEVGQALFEKLQEDEKCSASFSALEGTLPSYTGLGMAAMLPHEWLEIDQNLRVTLDGRPAEDLRQREAILQAAVPGSRCVRFDEIKTMKAAELREIFTGQEVVYVYHNQIDARGDHAATENEVFAACEEAIEEIFSLIKRLTVSANTIHYLVTADHGFLYKRDALKEQDKISGIPGAERRFVLSEEPIRGEGIASLPLSRVTGGEDVRQVCFPLGSDVFKTAGAGLNYVHGGSSPQEMILPLIDVKTERRRKETSTAQIALISLTTKITSLITPLDFLQTEPVGDLVKETTYRLYFISEDNEKISNERIYIADRRDPESANRRFRLQFSFKNRKYDKSGKYYLVALDEKTGLEVLRREMTVDIAFADDFGFGL